MSKTFKWAGRSAIPRREGDHHYLAVGASGSGKSTLINLTLQSVLEDTGVRAIVYDPKQELVPFLFSIRGFDGRDNRLGSSVILLHPWDSRGTAWDIGADIDNLIGARQLASILIPDQQSTSESGNFFTRATRDILTGIILAFIECLPNKGAWGLRDIVLTALYEPYLDCVLNLPTRKRRPLFMAERLKKNYLGPSVSPVLRSNIMASLSASLGVYEPVAAAWHHAESAPMFGGKFSLKKWVDEKPSGTNHGSIIVLGNDEAAREVLDPINRALFKRAIELLLARKERTDEERENGDNQIWVFLDEVREAGKLDGLGRLMTKGRSKNICVVAGFQEKDGMNEVYGAELANEICAQFNNMALLRVNSYVSAQWSSDSMGRRIDNVHSNSNQFNGGNASDGGFSMTDGVSEQELQLFTTDAFLFGTNAADAKAVRGIERGPHIDVTGLGRIAAQAACRFEVQERAVCAPKALLVEAVETVTGGQIVGYQAECAVSEFDPRPDAAQLLEPWTDDDFQRMGLTVPVPNWATSSFSPSPQANTNTASTLITTMQQHGWTNISGGP